MYSKYLPKDSFLNIPNDGFVTEKMQSISQNKVGFIDRHTGHPGQTEEGWVIQFLAFCKWFQDI